MYSPTYQRFYTGLIVFLVLTGPSLQCGRVVGKRKRPAKMIPLVHKQGVPNLSENTIGASGLSEGVITRDDPKFKQLVTNENPNIIFKDEEGNGSDQIMSQRCKDKLNTLAVSVMNTWPNVKLRVTEAWDEDDHHAKNSLHYEGRAVDITTSDRDRTKYGLLARLAVEAGFDWVYYESRGHIHCSVKSESSAAIKIGGCFTGKGTVQTPDRGRVFVSDIKVGDQVLAMTKDGTLQFSDVITFLDRDEKRNGLFFTLLTSDERTITLTDKHLIYTSPSNQTTLHSFQARYADTVKIGHYVLIAENTEVIKPSKIIDIKIGLQDGVYAPLTAEGSIVVDDVVASCYGVINSELIAHVVFAPTRLLHTISQHISLPWTQTHSNGTHRQQEGVNWYADFLYTIGKYLLDKDTLYLV
ncbi:sonic hedgehog protein A-like [Mizuhopecten yessoensis]|uniref:Hedgehog protein n=1 Tax=Mizuhopecten yessoensis TaxID=6573 RepID=A0A210Q4L7_MIZYE|nr:sonic hedgehog protein A-like [Mizuhopecten yessoensis]XP_021367266.1 sonic hedgehog protein A-like [Mizuhopecten yessoensis]OWF43690.1 Sonic hedgehog protein A [Mizuhopecten yessoensis]